MEAVEIAKHIEGLSVLEGLARYYYPVAFEFSSQSGQFARLYFNTSVTETDAKQLLLDMENPIITEAGLQVDVVIGSDDADLGKVQLLDDSNLFTASSTDIKTVKVGIAVKDSNGALELIAFEKTDGDYGETPSGYTYCCDVKEYTIAIDGTELTEV